MVKMPKAAIRRSHLAAEGDMDDMCLEKLRSDTACSRSAENVQYFFTTFGEIFWEGLRSGFFKRLQGEWQNSIGRLSR